VNRNVNKAVALASWVFIPAKNINAGISKIPPTPTVPINVPATNAVIASSIESNLTFQGMISARLNAKEGF
jgi:hypothetical protein